MSKTPVSVLYELMQRKGIVPKFDELPSERIGTHNPTFYFRVTAGDVSQTGKGRSKKDAKQEAARLALEVFKEMGTLNPKHVASTPPYPATETFAGTQINAVGILRELCLYNKLPGPHFGLISEIGPPHSRLFSVACVIFLDSIPEVIAQDLSMKKAKQAAAQQMLNHLKKLLPEIRGKNVRYPNTRVCGYMQLHPPDPLYPKMNKNVKTKNLSNKPVWDVCK